MSNATNPLAGIRVLDLTQIYNGHYATFLMAMAGADVIKVEPPGGEHLRRRNARGGALYPFKMLNPNKRSISLDLKKCEDKAIFLRLASTVDIVIENFAPGVVKRMGLDYEALKKENPNIIYASVKGFAEGSPYENFLSFDMIGQSAGGVLSITGEPDGKPCKPGVTLADTGTGMLMAITILGLKILKN